MLILLYFVRYCCARFVFFMIKRSLLFLFSVVVDRLVDLVITIFLLMMVNLLCMMVNLVFLFRISMMFSFVVIVLLF